MKRSLSRRTALGGGLAALVAPMFAGRAEASGHPPLRIGVLADLTGPLAQHGKQQLQGAQYRVEALNAAAGHGHDQVVELLVRDTASDEAKARDAVSRLLEEGVHALIAGQGRAVMDAAQASCTPLLTSSAAGVMPYVFQTGPSEQQVAKALLQAALKPKVGLLSLEGLSTAALEQEAAARGVALGEPQRFPATATELVTQLKTLVEQKPEAILVNALPPFDGMAVRDARAAGWTGPIVCTPEAANPVFHSTAGAAAEGVTAVVPWLAAAKQAPESIPHWSAMNRFAQGFEASNGPAGTRAGYGADAVSLLHLAFLGHRDRKAARGQLDQMCCIGVTGVYNVTPGNHAGLADDSLVAMTSQGGVWTVPQP